GQPLETNNRFAQPLTQPTVGRTKGDCREHAVAPSGHQFQALPRSGFVFRFREYAPAERNDGVAGEHVLGGTRRCLRLLARHPDRVIAGAFARTRSFVDIGGGHARRLDPETREQLATPCAGGSQDQYRPRPRLVFRCWIFLRTNGHIRNLPLNPTSGLGRVAVPQPCAGALRTRNRLLRPRTAPTGHEAIGNSGLGEVVRREFAQYFIADEY